MKSKGYFSNEVILLKAFKFTDLSDTGFCNPNNFLRTLNKLGINIVNKENLIDYFNLYDRDRTGRIKYRDFITEIFTPLEMKRRDLVSLLLLLNFLFCISAYGFPTTIIFSLDIGN